MVVFQLLDNTVWEPMRTKRANWMLAHEILLSYLEKVDQSVDKSMTLSNVFTSGSVGVDAQREVAKTNAAKRFGPNFSISFRSTGGTRELETGAEGGKPYNGKFTAKARQPCAAWNNSVEHFQKHLHADGTCKFKHDACSQWIVLADGSVGSCMRNHRRPDCDRPPAERSKVGPK